MTDNPIQPRSIYEHQYSGVMFAKWLDVYTVTNRDDQPMLTFQATSTLRGGNAMPLQASASLPYAEVLKLYNQLGDWLIANKEET